MRESAANVRKTLVAIFAAAAASAPCPVPSTAAISTPSAVGWTTYPSPDSRSLGNGASATAQLTGSPLIPLFHRDRVSFANYGLYFQFVHQPPRAGQTNS